MNIQRFTAAFLLVTLALGGRPFRGGETAAAPADVCVRSAACDSHNNCWFGTWNGLLARAAEGVYVNFTPANSGLAHAYCHDAAVEAGRYVWITHHFVGVSLFDYGSSVVDNTDDRWLTFTPADGLGSDFMIMTVAIDAQGRKWFGHDKGISVLDDKGTPFDKSDDVWIQYHGGQGGLALGAVNAILFDKQGCAWAGTDTGLSRLCGDAGTQLSWPGHNSIEDCPQWPRFVTHLALDAQGRVWVADMGCGAAAWDGSAWSIYDRHSSPLPVLATGQDVGISAVTVDPFENIWFGTRGRGAARLDSYGAWTLFSGQTGWPGPLNIEDIAFNRRGSAWFAQCFPPGGAHEFLLPESGAGQVSPLAGGELYSPDRQVRARFPAGAVDQAVQVQYQKALVSPPPGKTALRGFEISATISGTTSAVTHFNLPYTLTVHYTAAELGLVAAGSLGLYLRAGGSWTPLPGGRNDPQHALLEASLDPLSGFAVLGSGWSAYLPALRK